MSWFEHVIYAGLFVAYITELSSEADRKCNSFS